MWSGKDQEKREVIMAKKGVPRRNGSGRGVRENRGRGGCKVTRIIGKGRRR